MTQPQEQQVNKPSPEGQICCYCRDVFFPTVKITICDDCNNMGCHCEPL